MDKEILKRVQKIQTGGTVTQRQARKQVRKGNAEWSATGITMLDGTSYDIGSNNGAFLSFGNNSKMNLSQDQMNGLGSIGNAAQGIDSAIVSSSTRVQDQSSTTQAINAGYDAAADVISKMGPWGAVAGAAMKVGGMACDALTAAGIGTDQVSTTDKILDSKFMKLTPIGLVNAIGAKKSDTFTVDSDTEEKVGASYGGTYSDLEDTQNNKSNKKFGLLSGKARRKANKEIAEAKETQNKLTGIANEAEDQREAVSSMGDIASESYANQLEGGYQQKYNRIEKGGTIEWKPQIVGTYTPEIIKIQPRSAKNGGKLFDSYIDLDIKGINDWVPEIVEWEPEMIAKHENGGNIEAKLDAPEIEPTEQQNVIPEGALHKNKHHMDNAEDLTKKGIPVIDDDNNQQAEIERNEIIFTKEVTNKLEELYSEYFKEDATEEEKSVAAIEAGKLLTKEIMLNTDDRTGLIDTLKKGGEIKKKEIKSESKSEPKGISYEEWVIDVNPDFLNDNYDLRTAFEELPIEVLNNWKEDPRANHLPSVIEDKKNGDITFLKLGYDTAENPELWYEFDSDLNTPELLERYNLVFDGAGNRWKFIESRRSNPEKTRKLLEKLKILDVAPPEDEDFLSWKKLAEDYKNRTYKYSKGKGMRVPIGEQAAADLTHFIVTEQIPEEEKGLVNDIIRQEMHKVNPHKKENRVQRSICKSFQN